MVKNSIVIVLVLLAFGGGIYFGPRILRNVTGSFDNENTLGIQVPTPAPTNTSTQVPFQQTSSPQNTPQVVISEPVKLVIPSLKINAPVESVGMDRQGRMDVPKNAMNVGWYNLGYKPGEQGSAVMAGHYDRKDGSPAVFYNLESIKIGDQLVVYDKAGKEYKFKVTRKQHYQYDQVPLNEVFASKDKARLNLITCDGVFNSRSRNYSQRFVVYSEQI